MSEMIYADRAGGKGNVFPSRFLWGAASAAYQVEGAYKEDKKGEGIWDALSVGHVRHGENGNIACDHYHRYKEDIALMKKIGLKSYRFSVSWPRIMPEEGVVNRKGLEFYRNLVCELREAGIEPMCTLFHWNLPMWVYNKGGWNYEGISDLFAGYAEIVVDALSDQVTYWMPLNEPACFIGLGYMVGIHAPFEHHVEEVDGVGKMLPRLVRNVLLSHGKAVKVIREKAILPPKIGTAMNGNLFLPKNESAEEIEKAKAKTFAPEGLFFNLALWSDPVIKGIVPEILKDTVSGEDLTVMHQPLDFYGFNSYNSNDYDEYNGKNENVYPGQPRTASGAPITPDALYWNIRFLQERYQLPILITENGMANADFIMSDGKVHDPQRIEYVKSYLQGVKRAIKEGYQVIGYTYWSLMDNFEWAEGYDTRFGMIYVDYQTQKRIMKDSAYWYGEVIRQNGENI